MSARPIDTPIVPYPLERRGMVELFQDFFTALPTRSTKPTLLFSVLGGWIAIVMLMMGVPLVVLLLLGGIAGGGWWLFTRRRAA